ncbi:hypothetical protein HGP14_34095 [Rhizobium sp. P32RR-XVIII]|uniref:hypothetical protein n=1 Tax=Rhizobium sp. P32RR-XVIII TaxID=2726738 RepID=UPI0014573D3B|nr:hypothetical protein [Rhizobium sp. P32RR-XVIII]NLS08225.1 hypothetical protein [Rhizobium sp. P32RR-XVIII]
MMRPHWPLVSNVHLTSEPEGRNNKNAITNVEENVEPLEKMRALLGHSDRQQGRRTR